MVGRIPHSRRSPFHHATAVNTVRIGTLIFSNLGQVSKPGSSSRYVCPAFYSATVGIVADQISTFAPTGNAAASNAPYRFNSHRLNPSAIYFVHLLSRQYRPVRPAQSTRHPLSLQRFPIKHQFLMLQRSVMRYRLRLLHRFALKPIIPFAITQECKVRTIYF